MLKGDFSVVGNGLVSLDNWEREEVLGPQHKVLWTRGKWNNEDKN